MRWPWHLGRRVLVGVLLVGAALSVALLRGPAPNGPADRNATVQVSSPISAASATSRCEATPSVANTTEARIAGTVSDANGDPIHGVAVRAFRPGDAWVPALVATTGSAGDYVLDGAELDVPYRLQFLAPADSDYVPEWYGGPKRSSATDVRLSFATPVADVDAELAEGGSIAGSVVGPDGAPLEHVQVWAYRSNDRFVGTSVVLTAADGSYRIRGIDPTTQFKIWIVPPNASGFGREWFDDQPMRSNAAQLVVGVGQTREADAALAPSPLVQKPTATPCR